jgi:vacuolar protein sorting-associated protein 41
MFSGTVSLQPEFFLSTLTYTRYTANRQPAKALPFFIRLRRPNVFELIREHNLFTAVQDQALLLVEFDHELMNKEVGADLNERGIAITLLVDHIHSIPVRHFLVSFMI